MQVNTPANSPVSVQEASKDFAPVAVPSVEYPLAHLYDAFSKNTYVFASTSVFSTAGAAPHCTGKHGGAVAKDFVAKHLRSKSRSPSGDESSE
jgi:hypothetical protein